MIVDWNQQTSTLTKPIIDGASQIQSSSKCKYNHQNKVDNRKHNHNYCNSSFGNICIIIQQNLNQVSNIHTKLQQAQTIGRNLDYKQYHKEVHSSNPFPIVRRNLIDSTSMSLEENISCKYLFNCHPLTQCNNVKAYQHPTLLSRNSTNLEATWQSFSKQLQSTSLSPTTKLNYPLPNSIAYPFKGMKWH